MEIKKVAIFEFLKVVAHSSDRSNDSKQNSILYEFFYIPDFYQCLGFSCNAS